MCDAHERAEHEDAPEADRRRSARRRASAISEPIGAADRRRRELAQEEADRDRERRREEQRAERRDERADDELPRAEDVRDRVPGARARRTRSRSAGSPARRRRSPSRRSRRSRAAPASAASAVSAVERASPIAVEHVAGPAQAGSARRLRLPRAAAFQRARPRREGPSPLRHTTFTSCAPRGASGGRETRLGERRGASALGYPCRSLRRSASPQPPPARADQRGDRVRHRRPLGLLRHGARGQRRLARHLQERDHRADRPVGLRQVDVPALPEPDERPRPERHGRGQAALPRHRPLRRRASTRSRCAGGSAWSSSARTRSRSRSTTTSPTACASSA